MRLAQIVNEIRSRIAEERLIDALMENLIEEASTRIETCGWGSEDMENAE